MLVKEQELRLAMVQPLQLLQGQLLVAQRLLELDNEQIGVLSEEQVQAYRSAGGRMVKSKSCIDVDLIRLELEHEH